jgi:hypothetical protein
MNKNKPPQVDIDWSKVKPMVDPGTEYIKILEKEVLSSLGISKKYFGIKGGKKMINRFKYEDKEVQIALVNEENSDEVTIKIPNNNEDEEQEFDYATVTWDDIEPIIEEEKEDPVFYYYRLIGINISKNLVKMINPTKIRISVDYHYKVLKKVREEYNIDEDSKQYTGLLMSLMDKGPSVKEQEKPLIFLEDWIEYQ